MDKKKLLNKKTVICPEREPPYGVYLGEESATASAQDITGKFGKKGRYHRKEQGYKDPRKKEDMLNNASCSRPLGEFS